MNPLHCVLRRLVAIAIAALAFAEGAFPSQAAPSFPLRWRFSNPLPHGNNIIDMAYSASASLAVQVSERGQVYSSTDLVLWTPRDTYLTNALRSVAFFGANNRVIITGENGLALWSDDVVTFNPATVSPATTDWFEGVAASPELLVAVGDNSAIYTSPTGTNWTRQDPGFTNWLYSVCFGLGRFVAVGETGTILRSFNGTNWTRTTFGTAELYRVAFVNGQFRAVGSAGASIVSTDGASWANDSPPPGGTNDLFTVVAGQSGAAANRLLVGDSEARLNEGASYVQQVGLTNGPPEWTYYTAIARSNFFLLAGRTGQLIEGYKTNANPFAWFPTYKPVRNWLFDVHRVPNPSLYTAVGDRATVMTSLNGIDWVLELTPTALTNSIFFGIGGDTNTLVAVGDAGSIMFSTNALVSVITTNVSGTNITYTTNFVPKLGVFWTAITPAPTTNDLQGICQFNGQFIVTGGNGVVLASTNATNWVVRSTGSTNVLSSVVNWPGGLVAVGKGGTILTSPDATNWTPRAAGLTTNWVYRVRYLNGLLTAAGENATLLTSTNGTNWAAQSLPTTSWINDIIFLDSTFFACGTQGAFLTSTNATNWTYHGTATQKSLYGLATDGAQLINVGVEGLILRSQVVPATNSVDFVTYSRVLAGGVFQNLYLLNGLPDQKFTLDSIQNFTGLTNYLWTTGPLLEFTDSTGTLYYIETTATNGAPAREFFRTRLIP